jgi:hypothetical protein
MPKTGKIANTCMANSYFSSIIKTVVVNTQPHWLNKQYLTFIHGNGEIWNFETSADLLIVESRYDSLGKEYV